MYKTLIFIPFISTLLLADHHSQYRHNYEHSSPRERGDDRVISSSAEATGQISVVLTIQGTSEITSRGGRHHGRATMGFLDNNRMQITEDIAKGEGEHLETLLSMMKVKSDKKS